MIVFEMNRMDLGCYLGDGYIFDGRLFFNLVKKAKSLKNSWLDRPKKAYSGFLWT